VLIDYTLFALAHTVFSLQFGVRAKELQFGQPVYELEGYLQAVPVIIWILCFPCMEAFEGKTIGKRLLGIEVIKLDGSDYSYFDAFKRRAADWLDFAFLGIPAIIISKNTTHRQRLGDLFAKTAVAVVVPVVD
jgi:uncharacterized RDD family membrane protein YckC